MVSSICATHAIIERAENVTEEQTVEMIVLYDHEECGSESAQGAAGTVTNDALRRIFNKLSKPESTQADIEEDYHCALK